MSEKEVIGLESRGNNCSDWNMVRLLGADSLEAIHHCSFEGQVILRTENGPPKLWRSRLRDAMIGASIVDDIGLLERVVVEDQVVLRRVGEITGKAGSRFCLGLPIHPGSEMKTRRVFLCDGLLLSDCVEMAGLISAEQETLERNLALWIDCFESDYAFVGTGACLERVSLIENCYVGPGAVIRGASAIRRCVLAPSSKNPIQVGDGVQIEDSVLEPGSRVDSAAQVRRSLLLEFSSVERAGQVDDSVLGPNTHVSKGEVTASLLGPFTGFHHQALLIAALWPEGHGNVAYGSNVGSNHTGRKPDQEIRPGEGTFFGLGCSIKFPADFTAAPYTLFATGVITLPQRLAFPFSLVTPPLGSAPESAFGFNEILPGWMWGENAYALIRNAYKHLDRNRAHRHVLPDPAAPESSPLRGSFLSAGLFGPRMVGCIIHALLVLRGASKPKEIYLEKELPGLGKNFLRGKRLADAITIYEDYLRFALCRALLWSPVSAPLSSEASPIFAALGLKKNSAPGFDPAALFQGLIRSVESSLERDGKRGREVFHDYGAFHQEPESEPVCRRLRQDLDKLMKPLKKRWKQNLQGAA